MTQQLQLFENLQKKQCWLPCQNSFLFFKVGKQKSRSRIERNEGNKEKICNHFDHSFYTYRKEIDKKLPILGIESKLRNYKHTAFIQELLFKSN